MAARKKVSKASTAAAKGWQTRRRKTAEAEGRKLLAELDRWEENRKLLRDLERWERAQKRKEGETKRRATAKATAKKGKGKPPGKPPQSTLPPGASQAGEIKTLDDWLRRGEWLKADARPTILHTGSDYQSRTAPIKVELAVTVQKPPGVIVSEKMMHEAALYWIATGQNPAGMEFTAIYWERGRTKGVISNLQPEEMEEARKNMLARFFHLGK